MIPLRTERKKNLSCSILNLHKRSSPSTLPSFSINTKVDIPYFLHLLYSIPTHKNSITQSKINYIQHRFRNQALSPTIHTLSTNSLLIKQHTHNKNILKEIFIGLNDREYNEFLDELKVFEKKKKKEVIELCEGKHEDLLYCLSLFAKVNLEVKKIKSQIKEISNQIYEKRGKSYFKSLQQVIQVNKVEDNAIMFKDACQRLQSIMRHLHSAFVEYEKSNYYIAIKKLNYIEMKLKYLRNLEIHNFVRDYHSKLTTRIYNRIIDTFAKWMSHLQGRTMKIGSHIMKNCKVKLKTSPSVFESRHDIFSKNIFLKNKIIESNDHPCTVAMEQNDIHLQRLHTFSSCMSLLKIDSNSHFQSHFSEMIKGRIDKFLNLNLNVHRNVIYYHIFLEQFLHNIMGLLCVGNAIKEESNLLSQYEFLLTWKNISKRIYHIITEDIRKIDSSRMQFQSVYEIKENLVTFSVVVEKYFGFCGKKMFSLIHLFRQIHDVLLLKNVKNQCEKSFEIQTSKKLLFHKIANSMELEKIKKFGFKISKIPFYCSFSQRVVDLLDILNVFLNNQFAFDMYVAKDSQNLLINIEKIMLLITGMFNSQKKSKKNSSALVAFENAKVHHLDILSFMQGSEKIFSKILGQQRSSHFMSLLNEVIYIVNKENKKSVSKEYDFIYKSEFQKVLKSSEDIIENSMNDLFVDMFVGINSGMFQCSWEELFQSISKNEFGKYFLYEVSKYYTKCFRELYFLQTIRKERIFFKSMEFLEQYLLHRLTLILNVPKEYKKDISVQEICKRTKFLNARSMQNFSNSLSFFINNVKVIYKNIIKGNSIDLNVCLFKEIKCIYKFIQHEKITSLLVLKKRNTLLKKYKAIVRDNKKIERMKGVLVKFENFQKAQKNITKSMRMIKMGKKKKLFLTFLKFKKK